MTNFPPIQGVAYQASGGDPEYPFRPETVKYAFDSDSGSGTLTNTSWLSLANLTGGTAFSSEIEVELVTGLVAVVFFGARLANSTGGSSVRMSYAVSGATTIAASLDRGCSYESSNAADLAEIASFYVPTLTAGTNKFTLAARVTAGTGTMYDPRIAVLAL